MSPETWIAIGVWVIALGSLIFSIVAFCTWLKLRKWIDRTEADIKDINTNLTAFLNDTQKTLKILDENLEHTRDILAIAQDSIQNVSRFTSKIENSIIPQITAGVFGLIKGINLIKNHFTKRHQKQ